MIWVTDATHDLYDVRQKAVFQFADGTNLSADPATFSPAGVELLRECLTDGDLIAFTVDGRLVWIRGRDVVRVTFIPEDA